MNVSRSILHNERGLALITVLLVFVLLLTLGSAGLVYSVIDIKSTTHYDTGNQALSAAESGVLHALSTMNSAGVSNFQNDVVQRWGQLYGTGSKTMPSSSKVSYQVAVAADPTKPADAGSITVTGFAPLQAQRVLTVTVQKGGFVGVPGAIYLAAEAVTSTFSGNAFEVNGNDHGLNGQIVAGGISKPGIATRNDGVTNGVISSLSDLQKDNVQGAGFSLNPLTPSVQTTSGPSVADLERIVANLLALPGVVSTNQGDFNGSSETLGTVAAPKITRLTNPNVRMNGNASGAGILIADGSIEINGTFDFVGWIIVRGATVINSSNHSNDGTVVLGNATIQGSLWTGHLDIKVGGSAIIDYCDACLRLADQTSTTTANIPRPMTVVSWQEVM